MRVGFDVDGILADFNTTFIERVIAVTGKDLFPARPFDIVTWNYPESYGYTSDEMSAVWKDIKEDGAFWLSLKPYEDVRSIIGRLQRLGDDGTTDVYFITSRPGLAAKLQTEAWLEEGLSVPDPTVLISSDKGGCAVALGLTHYIDDRTENCQDVQSRSPMTACFMLARPWNEVIPGVLRITTLKEFPVFSE